jgi:hypothetical protein
LNYSNHIEVEFEHQAAILAKDTQAQFVGFYTLMGFSDPDLFAYAMNGNSFNQDFNNMSIQFFMEQLRIFNVEYIIGYSIGLRNFMETNQIQFEHIEEFGNYGIYRFRAFQNNLFILTDKPIGTINLIEDFPQELDYELQNVSTNTSFIISYFDFPNWHLYLNGTEISKQNSQDFIRGHIAQSGNYHLQIKWIKPSIEYIAESLNVGLIAIVAIIIIRKKVNKKV